MPLWLIFDMDGVVVDTAKLKISAYNKLFDKHNFGKPPSDFHLLSSTRPSEVFSGVSANSSISIISQEYAREYDKYLPRCQRFITDVHLMGLRGDDIKLALMTAQPRRRVDMIISNAVFDEIISEEDMNGKSKSDSQALNDLLHDGDSGIFVGDGADDIKAANQFGITSIFAAWGYTKLNNLDETPNYVVETPKELLSLLDGLLEGFL